MQPQVVASMQLPPPASRHRSFALGVALLLALLSASAAAGDRLSDYQRQQIIRDFLAEHPYVHRALPRGKGGIRIEGDKITPGDAEMRQQLTQLGAAAKPGERVRITAVHFSRNEIVFEINGGPMKRKSWKERISVGVNGIDPRSSQSDPDEVYNGAQGSSVTLVMKGDASGMTTTHIKELLEPVLDFKAMTVAEAYQKSLPPKLAEAVKKHHALVGMDKDMVTYALGRPPRRVRENKDGQDYEEWIYGTPPENVEFIRFVGDKVVSIEEMKVNGEKMVRTQDEVGDLLALDASARRQPAQPSTADNQEDRRAAPTLMRPGETATVKDESTRDPRPAPPPDMQPPPGDPNDPGAPKSPIPMPQ
jgi:hypothetical protein